MDRESYSKVFDGIGFVLKHLLLIGCICAPLALWKLIDIGFWLYGYIAAFVKF
jgi:hypothetical protein